jgi:glutamate--cysteine ligase
VLDAAGSAGAADAHAAALATQRAKLDDLSLTPSAWVLATMRDQQLSFEQFALQLSTQHARAFKARPLDAAQNAEFERMAADSLREQARLERDEADDFDGFVAAYQRLDVVEPVPAVATAQAGH